MTLSSRLSSYASLALAPVAVTSAATADTYTGSSTTSVTLSTATSSFPSVNLFVAGGVSMGAFVYSSSRANNFRTAGLNIPRTQRSASLVLGFFDDGSQSRVIDGLAGADNSNVGYGGWRSPNVTWNAGDIMNEGTGYMGFTYQKAGEQRVNGFIEYSLSIGSHLDGTHMELTILSWAYNVGSAITMPANTGGGGAVPGLGGLAALAMGAGGVRRKRSRVA